MQLSPRRARPLARLFGGVAAIGLASAGLASAQPSFIEFESGPVRPLALSPNGTRLFAVNIPDDRLEIFTVSGGSLTHTGSVPVGMEPVAVAARSDTEVWVVNHLSDSVSIVDLAATPPRVSRTLLVGDEPRDIVFAGTGGNRAFITTAHRGQQRTNASLAGVTGAGDPQLTTGAVDRADVWVFDATSLGTTYGGTPVRILTFRADTPRALARSATGDTVYVAAFQSGNQTTTINETIVCNGFQTIGGTSCGTGAPGGVVGPSTNAALAAAPEVGIVVKFDGSAWRDTIGRDWSGAVPFSLPDHDVFAVNANTLTAGSVFDHVGTILFNMVVNPNTGKLYVTNTELPNNVRFEGPGVFGGSTVQGHLSESRITVIDPAATPTPTVVPKHLNQHIVYANRHTNVGADHAAIDAQIPHSLATPLQAVVSIGGTIYVAAFGSAKIGVFSTADIEDPNFATNFEPTVKSANYIPTGGGPAGLALDEVNSRLYVLTRFDNSVRVINTTTKQTLETHALHNPEPASVVTGRPFLYDATLTSGNGEASCSSCHIFGDLDSLAWDLGNPDEVVTSNTQPGVQSIPPLPNLPVQTTFHPMKGPMTTQTLRGLATHGGMHWRGDRVDGFFGTDPCTEATGAPCNEDRAFRNFIVAFAGLVGKNGTITPTQMQQYANFILQIMEPPNPVRPLNNTLTGAAASGNTTFISTTADTVQTCEGCHRTSPSEGFFGSGGLQSFEAETQNFKVPHLRNAYSKVGMFFAAGDQVRGFGFLHDGSVDTLATFLSAPVFNALTATQRTNLAQFVLAFPSDLAPIVGQQVTLRASDMTGSGCGQAFCCPAPSGPDDTACERVTTMVTRAGTSFSSLMLGGTVTECDLVVKGSVGGVPRGWKREAGGLFRDDVNATISDAALRSLAGSEGPLTYTCAPPGSGTRMGIERDMDGLLDGFETNTGVFVSATNTGSDPAKSDTDGDGILDGIEVLNGTDPNDPLDPPPPSSIPFLPLAGRLLLAGALLAAGALSAQRTSRT